MYTRAKQRRDEEGKGTRYRYKGEEIPAGKIERAGADSSETLSIRSHKCKDLRTIWRN